VRAERCDAVALNVASTTAATTSGRTARGPLGHQSTAPAALNIGYPQTSGPCPRRRRLRTAVRRTSYCGESIGPRRCGGPRARRATNWTSFCRRARTPPKRCRASVGADRCDTARRRRRVRSCLWPRPAWLWRRLNRRQRRRGLCCGRAARWLVSRASPDGRSRLRVAAAASTTSCFGSALSSEAARAVFQSGALCGTTGLRRAARACSLAHFL